MSVRVNLLPQATKEKDRAAQQRSFVGLAGVLLLAVLGGFYWWAANDLSNAEDELMAEEARTAELRGDRAELIAFEELADRRELADQVLVSALGDEVSFAGILQDISAVMPGDAQLETLTITVDAVADPERPNRIGSFNIAGRSLTSHAPGVERVLLSLDKVISFRELYLNSSTLDDAESSVASFSLDGQLSGEAATGRYDDGLPEELR